MRDLVTSSSSSSIIMLESNTRGQVSDRCRYSSARWDLPEAVEMTSHRDSHAICRWFPSTTSTRPPCCVFSTRSQSGTFPKDSKPPSFAWARCVRLHQANSPPSSPDSHDATFTSPFPPPSRAALPLVYGSPRASPRESLELKMLVCEF